VKAIPTAKPVPAIPRPSPARKNCQYPSHDETNHIGTAEASSTAVKTGLPPHLSVAMPTGRRRRDPERTGMPMSHPMSAALHRWTPLSTRNVTRTP
jgi:hypothetical protein